MTVLRTDIERALDELISYEAGPKFQALAVVLAKQKWPELIACERKWDRGLDAHASAALARDGVGRGLACSLTARVDKVMADARKVRDHFSDVEVLIFATPVGVTNHTAGQWAEAVKSSFGLDLVVMPREDIVTELMLPQNAPICRSHLAIPVPVEAAVGVLLVRAQEAAREIAAGWATHPRLAGRPRIGLQGLILNEDGRDTEEGLDLDALYSALQSGRRIVLEAPAGRGKTTTLLQLAECSSDQSLAFLVDLPGWTTSGCDVLEFVARARPFSARGIALQDLARLCGTVQCVFLLNGWNEVSDSHSERAQAALADLERNFQTAGIIVATRSHHVRPPLPGSVRIRLLPLSRAQRGEYLEQALPGRAAELRGLLDSDRVLDDLTRTPLILAEVTAIFLSGGPVPRTKMGVLDAVLRLLEQEEQHRGHLVCPPLNGHARNYLTRLAVQMTSAGDVTVLEADARAIVHTESVRLVADAQIAGPPEPAAILSNLCAHHVLERLEYPSVAFRFQHQQFQECLAASDLARQLYDLIRSGDVEAHRRYVRDYVNRPGWEEPLRMIAEEIAMRSGTGSNVVEPVRAGVQLVAMALAVDPVFAADLARLCGPLVWQEVRGQVGERLRAWYRVADGHHRDCALSGMLASGSEDFMDILLPLLTSDDPQVRLRTYRRWGELHLGSVGPDWRRVVGAWKEEHRSDFVSEIVRNRRIAEVAEEFAATDSSPEVRTAALQALEWVGAANVLARVLAGYDDRVFEQVLRDRVTARLPDAVGVRALETYSRLLETVDDPLVRVGIRLTIGELVQSSVAEAVKEDLARWPAGRIDDTKEALLRSALEVVRRGDARWVSHWVAERIIDGSLWPDRWIALVSEIREVLREELLAKLCDEDGEHSDEPGPRAVLAATADSDLVGRAFEALCRVRTEFANTAEGARQKRFALARRLADLIRATPPSVAVAGTLARLSATSRVVEFEVVIELFGRASSDDPDLRTQLREDLRRELRRYLKDGLAFALAQEDFSGGLKAGVALALARVGEPSDMSDLERLIRADIERVRRGQAARLRHERSAMANGAAMRWSNWYVRAVAMLDPERAGDVFLGLLSEVEYEGEAAKALVHRARVQTLHRRLGLTTPDYSVVWGVREGRQSTGFEERRRRRAATAIRDVIARIMEARSQDANPESYNGRLKGLAATIACVDARESAELVMEILALPGAWDGWTRVEAVERLVLGGVRLDARTTLGVLDPTIEDSRSRIFHDQQARYLLQRCLSVLPFVDPCSVGVGRIREVVSTTRLAPYELREIVTALGHSRCDDALGLLWELAIAATAGFRSFATEWIDAMAALGTPDSKRGLLGFVDPDIGQRGVAQHLEHHHRERLAARIAHLAQQDPAVRGRLTSLCSRQLPSAMRLMLAEVLARFGTEDAMIAGLDLIQDDADPPVPHGLMRGIENVFLERRPYGSSESVYSLQPRSGNEIRRHLLAMVLSDKRRKRSAWALLGQIESWRQEYGRPASEPRHPSLDSGKPWPPVELAGELERDGGWRGN